MIRKNRCWIAFQVNPANSKVNGANAQSAHRRILFAQANGKLYFEYLKIFSVPENHLPLQGAKHLRSRCFLKRVSIDIGLQQLNH
jgi:hypothetical protein